MGGGSSFKDMLLKPFASNKNIINDIEMEEDDDEHRVTTDMQMEDDNDEHCVTLTEEDKRRIYRPWSCSIIIKIFGKKTKSCLC